MKKPSFRSALAFAMTLALLIAFLPAAPAAAAEEFTAKLSTFLDDGFNGDVGAWPALDDIGGLISFNLDEETTITIDYGEQVKFASAFSAIETDVPYPGHTGKITSLKLDGNEISMGDAYICDEGLTKGSTLRLTIRNEWNSAIAEQPLELAGLDAFTVLEVTFIVTQGDSDAPPPPPAGNNGGTEEFDPMGEYMAFLSIQVNHSWMFRNAWSHPVNGANGSWTNTDGVNYFDRLFVSNWGEPTEGVFINTVIAGNGTYRVSLVDYGDNFDIITTDDQEMIADQFNLLFISTNIPYMGDDIEFLDLKVIVGGRQVNHFRADRDQHPYITDGEGSGFYSVYALHHWEMDEMFSYNMPTEGGEVALEFTIAGFGYDKDEDEEPAGQEPGDENGEGEEQPEDTSGGGGQESGDEPDGGLGFWLWVIIGGAVVLVSVAVVAILLKRNEK
jgi:hypothetical protein